VPEPLLTLLAAKAKVGALVVGTALATTAVLGGGGTLVLRSVSDSSPAADVAASAEPSGSPSAEPSVEPSVGPSFEPSVAPSVEPSVAPSVGPSVGPSADPSADPASPAGAAVPFVCDDSKTHGQNVSAYARSLPRGPGRGELVSEAARSDCGKKAGDAAAEPEADGQIAEPVQPAAPAKAAKPGKPAKPAKPAKLGRS